MKLAIVLVSLMTFLLSSVEAATYTQTDELFALFQNKDGEKELMGLCAQESVGCILTQNSQVIIENNELVVHENDQRVVLGKMSDTSSYPSQLKLPYQYEIYQVDTKDFNVSFNNKTSTGLLPIHESMHEEDKYFCAPIPPGAILLIGITQVFSKWKKVRKITHTLTLTKGELKVVLLGKSKKHGKYFYRFSQLEQVSVSK